MLLDPGDLEFSFIEVSTVSQLDLQADPRSADSNWCSSIWRARSIPARTTLRSRSIP